MEDIKHIQQDAMAFEQNRQEFIKSHPERRGVFKNDIGHPIKALYTPLDLEERGFSYEKESYTGNDISESYFNNHYRCVFISRRKRL